MGGCRTNMHSYSQSVMHRHGTTDCDTYATRMLYESTVRQGVHESLSLRNVEYRESADIDDVIKRPVIIGLDVTGSMQYLMHKITASFQPLVAELQEIDEGAEFSLCFFDDIQHTSANIFQATQFERDHALHEAMDNVWFTGQGFGNGSESYSLVWWYALHKTKLDWTNKHGNKGLIITIGNDDLNESLRDKDIVTCFGADSEPPRFVDSGTLLHSTSQKFEVFHINTTEHNRFNNVPRWRELLGERCMNVSLQDITAKLTDIITPYLQGTSAVDSTDGGIRW